MILQRLIEKKKVIAGRYIILADGKEVGLILKKSNGWAYFNAAGWHRPCNTLRSAFAGAANYLNCKLPRGLR